MTTAVAPNFIGFLEPTDARWPSALQKVPHDFFHLPGYVRASGDHEGGEALLFLLDAGTHGMLVPLIKRSLASFGQGFEDHCDATSPYGYPCPLYWGDHWEDRLAEMHAAFEAFLKEQRVVSLFLRLNPFLGAPEDRLAALGEIKTHGPTVYIDLRDEEKSWAGINSANRTFITRMLKRGYQVKMDQWETLDPVIEAYYETMRRLNASPYYFFPKEFFSRLVADTPPHLHLGTCYTPDGDIMGGVFFTEVNGLVQYYLTGTFEAYMENSPSKLMINALRLWGLERGHHTLHLGGGLGARRDGLFEFKVRLSKTVANFSTFRKVVLPDAYRTLSEGRGELDGEFFPAYRKPA